MEIEVSYEDECLEMRTRGVTKSIMLLVKLAQGPVGRQTRVPPRVKLAVIYILKLRCSMKFVPASVELVQLLKCP